MAGFAAAHGLAHLTFTQRSIRAVLPIKAAVTKNGKPVPSTPQTLGDTLVACRMVFRVPTFCSAAATKSIRSFSSAQPPRNC